MVDLFDPPYLSAFQADFDPVGMGGRIGQNILDDAFRQLSRQLVFLQDNGHPQTGFDIGAPSSVHKFLSPILELLYSGAFQRFPAHHLLWRKRAQYFLRYFWR